MKEQQLKSAFDSINETYFASEFEEIRDCDIQDIDTITQNVDINLTYQFPYDDPFEEL